MDTLRPCAACAELVIRGTCVCPHCDGKACTSMRVGKAALLLGITLAAGCGGKDVQSDYTAAATVPRDSGVTTARHASDFADTLIERGASPGEEAKFMARRLADSSHED